MANEKQEQVGTTPVEADEVEAKTDGESVEVDLDALVAQLESGALEVQFADEQDDVTDVKSEDEETDEQDEEVEVKEDEADVEEKTEEVEEETEVKDAADETEEKAESDDDVEEKADEGTEAPEEDVEVKAEEDDVETADEPEADWKSELVELVAELDDDVEEKADEVEDVESKDLEEEVETKAVELNEFEVKRLLSMGMDEAEVKELPAGSFICGVERKSVQQPCDFCRGGCMAEKSDEKTLPSLLEIEGRAETDAEGTVVGSGYEPSHDVFIVDVKREDSDDLVELVYTGEGELWQWKRLAVEGEIEDVTSRTVVTMTEAEEIALKQFDGIAVGVYPDSLDNTDVYVVEIEGKDGKDVDVFVSLSGDVYGYDEYADEGIEEDADIKALEDEMAVLRAELELKRMFSAERRAELAEEGVALPDGSFPIVNEGDLRNAVQAFGRAKNQDAAKRHIKKRARALGRTDLLPDTWKSEQAVVVDNEDDTDLAAQLAEFEALSAEINGEES